MALHETGAGRWKTTLLPLTGVIFGLAVLLTRSWGVHVDEHGYHMLAASSALGDAASTGKPYGFYAFNYGLYQLLRMPAGWLHPLILPVFYVIVTILALWRLSTLAESIGASRTWTFVLLLSSPFVLFNATQLMMETAILPLLSVTLAGLLSMSGTRRHFRAGVWMAAGAAASVLVKGTALPAVLLLAVAFAPLVHFQVWPLVAGAVGGVLANQVMIWAIGPVSSYHYGGASQLLASVTDPTQWQRLPSYLLMWTFFAGPAWLAAVWSTWESRDALSKTLLAVSSLSIVGVICIQFATVPTLPFPRYAYPVVWVGLASGVIAGARSRKKWLPAAVLVFQLPWITALWPGTFPTIDYWPSLITIESYSSGGTILSGVPNYGWLATSPTALADLCVYVPSERGPGAVQAREWLQMVGGKVRLFDEQGYADFQQCSGAKVIVDRRFVDACELEKCASPAFRIRSCLAKDLRFYAQPEGRVQSLVCLP